MGETARDPVPDNLRGLLLLLVGAGHGLEPLLSQSAAARAAYSALYLFHVPAFAALSGLLSKPVFPPAQDFRALLQPLLLYQCAYLALDVAWLGHRPEAKWAWQPYWVLWFLLSLATWRALLPWVLRFRWPVLWGLGVALGAGALGWVGYPLSLSRTAVFLPCFLAGHLAPAALRAWLRTRAGRALGALAFAALAAWAFAVGTGRLAPLDTRLLYGSTPYSAMGLSLAGGMAARAAVLASSLVLTAAAWAWAPSARGALARLGAASLHPYAAHGLLLRALPLQGWLAALPAEAQLSSALGTGVLAVVLPGVSGRIASRICSICPRARAFSLGRSASVMPFVEMGVPTLTSARLRAKRQLALGSARSVPLTASGSTSDCSVMASRNAPSLNACSTPSRLRVPSGKIMTGIPLRSHRPHASSALRPESPSPRVTGTSPAMAMLQPKMGTLKSTLFPSHFISHGR